MCLKFVFNRRPPSCFPKLTDIRKKNGLYLFQISGDFPMREENRDFIEHLHHNY